MMNSNLFTKRLAVLQSTDATRDPPTRRSRAATVRATGVMTLALLAVTAVMAQIPATTLTKTGAPSPVTAPGTINWVLSLNNQNAGANVTVTDPMPAGTSLVTSSIQAPAGWTTNTSTPSQLVAQGNAVPLSTSFPIPFTPTTAATIASASTGGDGYRPFFYANKVYSLYHHSNVPLTPHMLYCADVNSGVVCPGSPFAIPTTTTLPLVPKTSTPYVSNFHTAMQFSEYVAPNGRLYFFAHRSGGVDDRKPVVVCVDMMTNTSCGMHTFNLPTSTQQGNFLEHVEGGVHNGKLYAHLGTGQVACYDTTLLTPGPCATGIIPAPAGFAYAPSVGSWPQRLEIGSRYFRWIKKATDATSQWIDCIDMAAGTRCTGFPMNPGVSNHSPMFPVSTVASAPVANGFCVPWDTPVKCFNTSNGGVLTPPPALATLVSPYRPNNLSSRSIGTAAFAKGKAFFIGDTSAPSTKRCFSYTPPHDCNWPATATTLVPPTLSIAPSRPTDHFYEAVADPYRDNCIWTLGDAGVLRAFDAVTGGTCGQSTTISKAIGLVRPNLFYCDGKPHTFTWGQMSIIGLTLGTHYSLAGSTFTIKNATTSGVVLTGSLTAATTSIAAIPWGVNQIQVEVNLNLTAAGLAVVNGGGNARVVVSWNADSPQICFQSTVDCKTPVTLSNTARAAISTGNSGGPLPDHNLLIASNTATVRVSPGSSCGGTDASTCCPPVTHPMVGDMFDDNADNNGTPYTESLKPTSVGTTSFLNGLAAYLSYLKFVCPQIANLKAEFFTGPVSAPVNPLDPSSPAGPLSPLVLSGLPTAIYNTSMGPSNSALNTALMALNTLSRTQGQYYRTWIKITGVNAAGATVACGFDAQTCGKDDTYAFMHHSPQAMRLASPTGGGVTASTNLPSRVRTQ